MIFPSPEQREDKATTIAGLTPGEGGCHAYFSGSNFATLLLILVSSQALSARYRRHSISSSLYLSRRAAQSAAWDMRARGAILTWGAGKTLAGEILYVLALTKCALSFCPPLSLSLPLMGLLMRLAILKCRLSCLLSSRTLSSLCTPRRDRTQTLNDSLCWVV